VGVLGDDLKLDHDFKGHLFDVPTTLSAVAQEFLEENPDIDEKLSSMNSNVNEHKYTKLKKLLEELPHNNADKNDPNTKSDIDDDDNDNDNPENRDDSTRSLLSNHEQVRLTKAQKKFDKYFEGEANIFCYRLAWRLKTNELMDFVKVVEIKRLTPDEKDSTAE